MLQDIVCCFLDDPVHVDALGFGKAVINVFDTGLESDLGCRSDRPYQGFDCLRQAEAIQLKWPQIVGNGSSFLDRLRDFTAHFFKGLLLFVLYGSAVAMPVFSSSAGDSKRDHGTDFIAARVQYASSLCGLARNERMPI
jgi:hypothetical protein